MLESESHKDMTDSFEVYRNGKTVTCVCGHKIGMGLDRPSYKCPSCNVVLIDEQADERVPPKTDSGQTKLGDW
jgi:rubrerythrin